MANRFQNNSNANDMSFSVDMPRLADADVVSLSSDSTYKVDNLKNLLKKIFLGNHEGMYTALNSEIKKVSFSQWLNNGLDGEILRLGGKGWQKGKLQFKITLEFHPDQLEVDDLPASNKQVNQAELLDDILLRMDR